MCVVSVSVNVCVCISVFTVSFRIVSWVLGSRSHRVVTLARQTLRFVARSSSAFGLLPLLLLPAAAANAASKHSQTMQQKQFTFVFPRARTRWLTRSATQRAQSVSLSVCVCVCLSVVRARAYVWVRVCVWVSVRACVVCKPELPQSDRPELHGRIGGGGTQACSSYRPGLVLVGSGLVESSRVCSGQVHHLQR